MGWPVRAYAQGSRACDWLAGSVEISINGDGRNSGGGKRRQSGHQKIVILDMSDWLRKPHTDAGTDVLAIFMSFKL